MFQVQKSKTYNTIIIKIIHSNPSILFKEQTYSEANSYTANKF